MKTGSQVFFPESYSFLFFFIQVHFELVFFLWCEVGITHGYPVPTTMY